MKYRFEHVFDVSPEKLMETMFRKGVTEELKPDMTTIVDAETLEYEDGGDRIRRRVRYLPVPAIRSVGIKKVQPEWMEWVEESELDKKAGHVTYRNVPTTPGVAQRLENHGEMSFDGLGPDRTRRVISGELHVKVRFFGRLVEPIIKSYAGKILEDEARALMKFLRENRD